MCSYGGIPVALATVVDRNSGANQASSSCCCVVRCIEFPTCCVFELTEEGFDSTARDAEWRNKVLGMSGKKVFSEKFEPIHIYP